MFPDSLPMRVVLRSLFFLFDQIPLIALALAVASLLSGPAPGLASLFPRFAANHPIAAHALDVYACLELVWWAYDRWDRRRIKRKFDRMRTFGGVPEDEKWRLLKAMCTTDNDACASDGPSSPSFRLTLRQGTSGGATFTTRRAPHWAAYRTLPSASNRTR